jgi:LPXTG-site transpeptidase (sortase) family protein
MGQVSVPKLGLQLPIYHGTDDETLDHGVGHLYGTSLPIGGNSTHTVVTAHSGSSRAPRFTPIHDMKVGDDFYLSAAGQTLKYRVDQILVVEPDDIEALQLVPGRDLATLLTCTPRGLNSHRLLVRGERVVEPVVPITAANTEMPWWAIQWLGGVVGVGLLAFISEKLVTRKPSRTRVATIAVGALALAITFSSAGVPDATALELPDVLPRTLPVAGTSGSLEVTKHGIKQGDGQVTFSAELITAISGQPVDLTKAEGWKLARGAEISGVPAFTLAGLTTANGAAGSPARFSLPVGLYLVRETTILDAEHRRSEPFLVAIPYPDEHQKWRYQVVAETKIVPPIPPSPTTPPAPTPSPTTAAPTAPPVAPVTERATLSRMTRTGIGVSILVVAIGAFAGGSGLIKRRETR